MRYCIYYSLYVFSTLKRDILSIHSATDTRRNKEDLQFPLDIKIENKCAVNHKSDKSNAIDNFLLIILV